MSPGACLGASAPSNLLLFGEYAVTVPGGLGIACGLEPRVSGVIEEAPSFSIRGTTGHGAFDWEPGNTAPPGLLSACVRTAAGAVAFDTANLGALEYRITLDSSALYREDGTKRGFGSSAAVAVVLSALLLCLFRGSLPPAEDVFGVALRSHRTSQGGRGSGYDVAASTFGRLGLFEGGETPGWHPLSPDWLPAIAFHQGPEEVSTAPAIRRFEAWRKAAPKEFRAYLEASNRGIAKLAHASSWKEAAPTAERLSALGRELGRYLDTPAEVPPALRTCREEENRSSLGPEPTMVKAVGAGGELFVLFGAKESHLRLAEGIRWHT
ncbi:MAG: mevalonate kinase [Spirochaetota bacterium]